MDLLIEGEPLFGRVIFAHGAGAGMESDFMKMVSRYLAERGLQVIRFEFPYMKQRRIDGKKRPPDRADKLVTAFKDTIEQFAGDVPIYLAGKSMGGRIATMILQSSDAQACFVFGYPFHPVGKLLTTRTDHFWLLSKPVYVFQGERDPMGCKDEVAQYSLPPTVQIRWLPDGNHDLKPRKVSGFTQQEHIHSALDEMLMLIKRHSP
ncbi:alpha/beta family hydrolase [Neptunomonas sp.]|uniref:alpha/beta family hydrolase n=1 Tax=Neptunomonas sp. TaxID=1971898 RepID=UPI0035656D94